MLAAHTAPCKGKHHARWFGQGEAGHGPEVARVYTVHHVVILGEACLNMWFIYVAYVVDVNNVPWQIKVVPEHCLHMCLP